MPLPRHTLYEFPLGIIVVSADLFHIFLNIHSFKVT
jgi:hypothetical protein